MSERSDTQKLFYKSNIAELIHGDCMRVMDEMILDDRMVDCSIVDIPFGEVNIQGAERAKYKGQLRKIDKGVADVLTFDETEFCERLSKITRNSIYVFCAIEQVAKIHAFFKNHLKRDWMSRVCIWHKTNPSPLNGQHMYLSATEFVVFAKRRRSLFNGHCEHNVFRFPTRRSKLHPTEKPQELLEHLIKMSSNKGDVIFDCCFGSGSTGVASVNLQRKFLGIEIEEKYCDIAKRRLLEMETVGG